MCNLYIRPFELSVNHIRSSPTECSPVNYFPFNFVVNPIDVASIKLGFDHFTSVSLLWSVQSISDYRALFFFHSLSLSLLNSHTQNAIITKKGAHPRMLQWFCLFVHVSLEGMTFLCVCVYLYVMRHECINLFCAADHVCCIDSRLMLCASVSNAYFMFVSRCRHRIKTTIYHFHIHFVLHMRILWSWTNVRCNLDCHSNYSALFFLRLSHALSLCLYFRCLVSPSNIWFFIRNG